MFVKIIQKWNAFKQNWAEYQRLRRVAARAWHKLDGLRAKITVVYRETEQRPQPRCIATKILETPQMVSMDDCLNSRTPMLVTVENYCPHFNGGVHSGRPCNEKTCPHYAENCEYVSAAQEYKAAVEQRRTFWSRVRNKIK